MLKHYDLIVLGLGVMGSAVLWQAARDGKRALGLEKGGPTHREGSSHGKTRIFRKAYWEGTQYLPLLELADQNWQTLEEATGRTLKVPCGGLFIGHKGAKTVAESLKTVQKAGVPHEHLTAEAIHKRFPQFSIPHEIEAVFEPNAYILKAEEARLALLDEAIKHKAHLFYGTEVFALESRQNMVSVYTQNGDVYQAPHVVLCLGPWMTKHLPELASLLSPYHVVVSWFKPPSALKQRFSRESLPIFLYENQEGKLLYGIPEVDSAEEGVKIGFHNHQHLRVDPSSPPAIDLEPFSSEIGRAAHGIFPDLPLKPSAQKSCFYTMTQDQAFLLGESRQMPGVFYLSACSGHGFKFAPALGQMLCEKIDGKNTRSHLKPFSAQRFLL